MGYIEQLALDATMESDTQPDEAPPNYRFETFLWIYMGTYCIVGVPPWHHEDYLSLPNVVCAPFFIHPFRDTSLNQYRYALA